MLAKHDFLSKITSFFVDSKLVPLIIIFCLFLGAFGLFNTPSEEEPQIVVPMIDIFVSMPKASPKEIETRVIYPMERLLWEVPGVEYVYSQAQEGSALTTVRFYVGEDEEASLIRTYAKLYQHLDWIPPGCSMPLLKPKSIDDVPILSLTLWSNKYSPVQLRTYALALQEEIKSIFGVSEIILKGGKKLQAKVLINPERLALFGLDIEDVAKKLIALNQGGKIGEFSQNNYTFGVKVNGLFTSISQLKKVIIAVVRDKPVFLRDVAKVVLEGEENKSYHFFVPALASKHKELRGKAFPAVTLAIAKRKGFNATFLANEILKKIEIIKGKVYPEDLNITVTRNYGKTAKEKSDELLEHLFIATFAVAFLVILFLGFRASFIVMIAVPVTLAITLFIYYFMGYTLNRVTLFALIFCIGILVDDPIVDVENIVRHIHLPENKDKSFRDIIVGAVNEVRSPLVLATFTVIVALMPMAFVRGLMGPYMRPMPIGASLAMFFSMVVAFIITPWSAYKILKPTSKKHEFKEDFFTKVYRQIMNLLLKKRVYTYSFLLLVFILLLLSLSLIYFKKVYVKMLPFDNKSEFQLILDYKEGTSLEENFALTSNIARKLNNIQEIENYQIYVGDSAPYNFNGLIRHYYLRQGSHMTDIQVNLVDKYKRNKQSHQIAKEVRKLVSGLVDKEKLRVKVAEIPPGPPVLQTLVLEVYGPDYKGQIALAKKLLDIFDLTLGVVDADWYMSEEQKEQVFYLNKLKIDTLGVEVERIYSLLKSALAGKVLGLLHKPDFREDVPIFLHLERRKRSSLQDLLNLKIRGQGEILTLGELVEVREKKSFLPIYHKNLLPVVYVTGDVTEPEESPVYAMLKINKVLKKNFPDLKVLYTQLPFNQEQMSVKWDGEWQITYEVFRDLGIAFLVAVLLIYLLVVGWFKSYLTPLTIMIPIPLSLIGIIPAHYAMQAFFTATSMIGFIAGAGIVVRNSIILVDFIELRLNLGDDLKRAVIEAGAVRFRPMLLTALSVIVGSAVILKDPIFQGLAISLMAGEVAATFFSRLVVPMLYFVEKSKQAS